MKKIVFQEFKLKNEVTQKQVILSYQLYGKPLNEAPLVVVNHALTGNSTVGGTKGWWNQLIGENKCIDTLKYSIIAFDIPGNGYQNEENTIENYTDFSLFDVATVFWKGLDLLNISQIFTVIGGSLGGAIAWEMAAIRPKAIQHLIPIATNWKASDWIIANIMVQKSLLSHQDKPLEKARIHAMLLYRTPQSLAYKFKGNKEENTSKYLVENWLNHHGIQLKNRFHIQAYKLMNHLLKTTNVFETNPEFLNELETTIHVIAIDSDGFYSATEIHETYQKLKKHNRKCHYYEINSIHGHDAFLIEFEQLTQLLKPIFSNGNTTN